MASAVSDVLFYLEVDRDAGYRFLSVNPAFLKATGLEESGVVGRTVAEVIPEPARATVLGKYAAAIEARRTITWDETTVYPAGTKYGEVSVTPIFDADGRCTNLLGIVHDVTERRVAQERLAAQAALLDQAKDAILVRDLDGTVRYWNKGAERLFGWSAAEAEGRRVTDLFSRGPSAFLESSGQLRIAGEWSGEEVFTTRTGRKVVVEVSCTLLRDDRGEPRSILVINTDATERKRAEAELDRHRLHLEEIVAARTAELAQRTTDLEAANARLQEVDRLKSLFIASMSHELRTPLNSIIGFTGILLQGLAGPLNDEQKKQLGMVKGSSEHLLALITDIIDLSKVEAGKISLSAEDVDLVRLARDVLDSLGPAAARAGLALALEAPESLRIVSDRSRVRQVLVNLVGNAVKFTERGTVTVALERRDDSARIAVRDTGPGIRAEDMGRLFQFFSRVTATGLPAREGTGLGLYLSRKLVTLLGGEIGAQSEPGQGSEFAFTLPMTAPREST
jgi:PAS domain S-box-containing protein